MTKTHKQFGLWSSSITAKSIANLTRLDDVQWARDVLVWSEGSALRCQQGTDAPRSLTEEGVSVRGRVGYGGGAFTVGNDQIIFAGDGGRLYRQPLQGGSAAAITPGFGSAASPALSSDGEWVAYVYTYEGKDGIALVDANGRIWPRKLASGTDFVMQPVWHPEGRYLAYIAWDHPNMPWDGTELHLAEVAKDHVDVPYIQSSKVIAGNENTSIFQPEFSPDGRYLAYISDETGYGQIYVLDLQTHTHIRLTNAEAEHGTPAWIQGLRMYGWAGDSQHLYFLRNKAGIFTLHRFHITGGVEEPVPGLESYTKLEQITVSDHKIALIGSSSVRTPRLISLSQEGQPRIHARSSTENLPEEVFAPAQPIEWQGVNGVTVYGMYYAPASTRFEGSGTPPLMILVHGGPTSQRTAAFDDEVQFYATRGYAVLQVNHRGSTGYGREYMNRCAVTGDFTMWKIQNPVGSI